MKMDKFWKYVIISTVKKLNNLFINKVIYLILYKIKMDTCGVIRTYHKEDCDDTYCDCDCNETNGIQLKEEYFQNAGKIEGEYRSYHENGQIWQKVNYIDGIKID